MARLILSKTQVDELVRANRYKVDEEHAFIARCIDGRYPNDKDLPALAIPGADAGELGLLFATGREFGFEIDGEKALRALMKVVDGEKNLNIHSDCGHIKQMSLDPDGYNLDKEETEFIKSKFSKKHESILQGEHQEGAIVIVQGEWGIYPQYRFETGGQATTAQVFIFHKTLIDRRHKAFSKKLIELDAVKMAEGCDEEYLYEVLSKVAEDHLMETAKRLAKTLPIFEVQFDDSGGYEIEDRGVV